jgi:dihydropteroate synthase
MTTIGGRTFRWGERTYVMGIVNASPDSFAGGHPVDEALRLASRAIEEGADIVEVGGVSYRPGSTIAPVEDEVGRLRPVLRALTRDRRVPIGVDAWRPDAVRVALECGADLINSIWGLRKPDGGWNDDLGALLAAHRVPVVLTHNRDAAAASDRFGGHYPEVSYANVVDDVVTSLREQVARALDLGIRAADIILDPGLGLGKTSAQSLELIDRTRALAALKLPVLVGASRKSFIGRVIGVENPMDRDLGTAAITAIAARDGVDVVRVHNVAVNVAAARIGDAVGRRPETNAR